MHERGRAHSAAPHTSRTNGEGMADRADPPSRPGACKSEGVRATQPLRPAEPAPRAWQRDEHLSSRLGACTSEGVRAAQPRRPAEPAPRAWQCYEHLPSRLGACAAASVRAT
jgi:hypothetical protein